MHSTTGSVTGWIREIKDGERDATRKVWERYFQELLHFFRGRFKSFPRRMADEEDVVLHAFDSFFRDAENGRLPELDDRQSLWRLLIARTCRRAFDSIRVESALKRTAILLDQRPQESPADTVELADLWDRLLHDLGDDARGQELRQIAIWKMENYTNAEIAARLEIAERTVERKLNLIRKTWEGGGVHGSDT